MPEYIVKTIHDRNLVIEADKYNFNATENAYEFFKKDERADTRKVATVLYSPEILAVVENDTEKADFYDVYDLNAEDNEDECDDTCLDCRLEEFTRSDTFFDEVYSIIDAYYSKDNQDEPAECPCSETAPAQPEPSIPYPIEHWRFEDGTEWYGFWTPKGFVNFAEEVWAEDGRLSQISNPEQTWAYINMTGATRLED